MATNKFKQVVITSEFITLGQFLKFEGIIDQGNLAKDFIMSHECKVNDEITYQRILDDNLKVIDSQAAEMCVKSGIPGFVFNMNDENNIVKAVKGETIGTIIK